MKKLIIFFSALALISSCAKIELTEPVQDDQSNNSTVLYGDLPEVLYATVADNNDKSGKTRTVVAEDGQSILWNTGDAVSAFFSGISNAQYQYDGDDAVTIAELKLSMVGHTGTALSRSYAVYPYHEGNTSVLEGGVEKLKVNFPAEQNYAANSFGRGAGVMVGVGETADDTDFYFRNACGYLVIKLKGEGVTVKSIALTALGGEKIAGTGLITASHGAAPVVAMTDEASSTITLNCGNGVALGADATTEFWFAMPPVTFSEGFKIHVASTSGLAFEMQTSKKVEITRNDIQPMAALQYTPNTQLPNQFVYTRSDGSTDPIEFHENVGNYPFNVNASIKAHYYDGEKFIIECNAPITGINAYAFYQKQLATVSFPNQLKVIGDFAFYGTHLQELVFPGSVTLSGKSAFRGCRSLTTITFLWGEEELELREDDGAGASNYGPFYNSPLESLCIDRNIRYRDEDGDVMDMSDHGLFRHYPHDDNAHPVVFGPNVTIITDDMFCNLLLQPQFVIPGNINHIGKNAFRYRTELTELTFEPSPTNTPLTIDCSEEFSPFILVFEESDKLTKINLNRELVNTLEDPDRVIQGVFGNRPALRTVVLGEQVKTISDYMFAGRTALTSVTLPEGLTSIGNNAFEGCTALTSVNVPSTVTTMGNNVFKNCDKLTIATLGAQTIGTGVLYDCDELHTVTIKGTVNEIGNDAFYSCGAIKNVNLEPSAEGRDLTLGYQTYGTDEQGPFYDGVLETVNWNRNISYTLANAGSADQDDEGLFSKMSKLTSVNIGEQVRTIPPYTFANSGLTSITIPASVTSIGNDAFTDCDALHTVNIESSTSPIKIHTQTGDWGTFYDSPLSTIKLDREVNYVNAAGSAFTLDDWDEGVFANEEYNGDFTATVTLGSNVKTIWPWMFSGVRMQNVTIPASVTSIGKEAFYDCRVLTHVTCEGTTAPTLGEDAFDSCDVLPSKNSIAVPASSLSDYQSKWSEYKDMLYAE